MLTTDKNTREFYVSRLALLFIPLASLLFGGCGTTPSTKGNISSTIHGESTISIGTYGNVPVRR